MDLDLFDMLEKAEKEDILTIITMSLWYFTTKFDYSLSTTLKLVKKGYKELEKHKERG